MSRPPLDQLHLPVLVEQCFELLAPALEKPGSVLVDATLGMGGHSAYFLEHLPHLQVIGIDRDAQARAIATQRLAPYGQRVQIFGATYDQVDQVVQQAGLSHVDAILADLGVSSLQLDQLDRGFSYAHDAPLDMRMNQDSGFTAAELLAQATEEELARIFHTWGEERFSRPIARAIVQSRATHPVERTGQLAQLISQSIPAPARRSGGNPAKRVFQALRVAVNAELDSLAGFLPRALALLPVGGRLLVESYQSLEDKLVKAALREGTHPPVPPGLPQLLPEHEPWLRDLTRGAQKADAAEIAHNSRATAVRLRAVEVLASPVWAADSAQIQAKVEAGQGLDRQFQTKFPILSALRANIPNLAPVHPQPSN